MVDRPNARDGHAPAPGRVAVVVSRYNATITRRLLEGARGEWERRGGDPTHLIVYEAAGSFEVPVIARAAAGSGEFGAVVALSCIVRGKTRHDRHLARAVTDGLMSITLQTGVPIGLGVLTVENASQAAERAGGKLGNKGSEAMAAALDAARVAAFAARGAQPPEPIAARHDKALPGGRRGR